MKIDTEKICKEYGNVSEFLRTFEISKSSYTTLRYKKTPWFRDTDGGSYRLFKKLEKMGYIKSEEKA